VNKTCKKGHIYWASSARETLKVSLTDFRLTPVILHCTASVFESQVSCQKPAWEGTQCVELFVEKKSATHIQRRFRTTYHKMPPSRPSICACHKTGSVLHKKGTGRLLVSDENIERICRISVCGPRKSTRAAVGELQIPHSTAHRVSQKRLCLYSYKLQVVQVIMPDDTVASKESACLRNWTKTVSSA
jgi:hypothetical protein